MTNTELVRTRLEKSISVLDSLRAIPKPVSTLGILVILGGVALLDSATGTELNFSSFYYLTVSLAVLVIDRGLGLGIAALAAILWEVVGLFELQESTGLGGLIWSLVVRLINLGLLVLLLNRLRFMIYAFREFSMRDPLTQAANRRYFLDFLEKSRRGAARNGQSLALVYFDVDDFKSFNDSEGHAEGDRLLKDLCIAVQGHIRAMDLLARFGGDEFVVLLPATDHVHALEIIPRIFREVQEEIQIGRKNVTLSVGACTFANLDTGVEAMLSRVDELMYESKKSGKNKISIRSDSQS